MASIERSEGSLGIDLVPERLRVLGTLDTGGVDQVNRLDPPEWQIGATVPSFLASFLLAGTVAVVSRRFAQGAAAT